MRLNLARARLRMLKAGIPAGEINHPHLWRLADGLRDGRDPIAFD